MTLPDLDRVIHSSPTHVILLEGRREISPEFALRARATDGFLASRFSTFAPNARVAIRGEEWLIMETQDSPSIRIFAVFGNIDA